MNNCKCSKEAIIKELIDKLNHLETKMQLAESNISAVKEDIKDMKSDIKGLTVKVDSGFKKIDNWLIWVLVTIVIGIAINYFK